MRLYINVWQRNLQEVAPNVAQEVIRLLVDFPKSLNNKYKGG
jgi:hypothetical protein